jgi:hypothetical protein
MAHKLEIHIMVTSILKKLLFLSIENDQVYVLLAHDVQLNALFDYALSPFDKRDPLRLVVFDSLEAYGFPNSSVFSHSCDYFSLRNSL